MPALTNWINYRILLVHNETLRIELQEDKLIIADGAYQNKKVWIEGFYRLNTYIDTCISVALGKKPFSNSLSYSLCSNISLLFLKNNLATTVSFCKKTSTMELRLIVKFRKTVRISLKFFNFKNTSPSRI